MAHPGAAIVLRLVTSGPMTEKELREAIDDASQSTINRRLDDLSELGLLIRAPGARQAKDRPWSIGVIEAADSFLGSALELSRAIAEREEEERNAVSEKLRGARRDRRDLGSIPRSPEIDSKSD